MNKLFKILISFFVLFCFIILSITDLNKFKHFSILIDNIKLITSPVVSIVIIFAVVSIVFGIISNDYFINIEKLNFGIFSISLQNPSKFFKKKIKSFLISKRTLFFIDPNNDNFEEVFNSYYETYKFIREIQQEMSLVSNKNKDVLSMIDKTSDILRHLNSFLTHYQSNYRRWIKYKEISNQEKFYGEKLKNIQKNFYEYNEMISGFKKLNKFFSCKISNSFDISQTDINNFKNTYKGDF